jgi:hypothetical protein
VVLLGIVPLATLGAVLVNWQSAQSFREILNRACTGLCASLLTLGLGEMVWSNLSLPQNPTLQLSVMLLLTAFGAAVGTMPRTSELILNSLKWSVHHLRWLMFGLGVVVGGGLGFALTAGFAFGIFTPFGVLLGVVAGVALVMRVDRMIRHP